jgi:hypothetical protein
VTKGNIHIFSKHVIQCFLSIAVCSTKVKLYLIFAHLRKDNFPYVKASHRKEVWESEDTDPRILNLRIEEVFAQLRAPATLITYQI